MISQEPMIIGGFRCTPYLIGNVVYPIHKYLQKNWKTKYPLDVDKKRFDDVMNTRKVVMKNAFESLKNRWHILTHFNSRVNQVAPIKVACCVFHN